MLRYLLAGAAIAILATPASADPIVDFGSELFLSAFGPSDACDDANQCITSYSYYSNGDVLGDSNGTISNSVGRESANAAISLSGGGAVSSAASITAGGPFQPYNVPYPHPNYPGLFASQIYADIIYNFEVLGPGSGGVAVPAIIHSFEKLVTSGDGGASTYFSIFDITGNFVIVDHTNQARGAFSSAIQFNDPVTLLTNHTYVIGMEADAVDDRGVYENPEKVAYDPGFDNSGSGYAYVDPSITIDPSYAAQYHIYGGLLGPPIPVASGTPEPATWALLFTGFGLVGAAVRRRRVAAV